MNSSNSSPTKKHAVITIEPLSKDLESDGKLSASLSASQRQYPSDALAELQRQQRKRLVAKICSCLLWIILILFVGGSAYAVYYFNRN